MKRTSFFEIGVYCLTVLLYTDNNRAVLDVDGLLLRSLTAEKTGSRLN